jgi:hypothetical protein
LFFFHGSLPEYHAKYTAFLFYFICAGPAVRKDYEREIIGIDGKTVRGRFKGRESPAYAG